MLQDWTGSAGASWATSGAATGSYMLAVWVRAAGSTAAYENFAIINFTLQ